MAQEMTYEAVTPAVQGILVSILLLICLLPLLLSATGIDLGAPTVMLSGSDQLRDGQHLFAHQQVAGSLIHTILEWSACCVAIVTALLAFAHYSVERDPVVPVIGIALFWAGCMDAFHTLAAGKLILASAASSQLIPLTWSVSRVFNAFILIIGAIIFLTGKGQSLGVKGIALTSLFFGLLAFAFIQTCATASWLPNALFPDQVISRPWDVLPLLLFVIAGCIIFPLLHKRLNSLFSFALWLSALPAIATQLYMAFGSEVHYDHYFNTAHFLKLVSYAVPFAGIFFAYILVHQTLLKTKRRLLSANDDLELRVAERTRELTRKRQEVVEKNNELETLLFVASHDLKEPLRGIESFATLLERSYSGNLDDKGKDFLRRVINEAHRMGLLLEDLLQLSRVRKLEKPEDVIGCKQIVDEVLKQLEVQVTAKQGVVEVADNLPSIVGNRIWIKEAVYNLISNSLKFIKDGKGPEVSISRYESNGQSGIMIEDRGIGVAENQCERIFLPFQRAVSRDIEGNGAGLAIVRYVAEIHGGKAWCSPREGGGASFVITFGKAIS